MKHITYIVVFALSLCSVPLCAETSMSDDARSSASDILPFSESYSHSASSPVNIQLPGFSLTADSGSLQHDIAIQLSVIPRKGVTLMPSNMENVCWLSDGVQLLPGGVHFSEDNPALISLAYDPDRLPMGYKPKEVYTYYCDDARSWHFTDCAPVVRH